MRALFLNTFLFAIAGVALAAPLGASAQPAPYYNPALGPDDPAQNLPPEGRVPDWTIDQRMQWTEQQLERAQASGNLNGGRIEDARAQLAAIRDEEARLKGWHGQFTRSDQAYLFRRLDQVDSSLGLGPTPWGA